MDGERESSWDLFEENARDLGMLSLSRLIFLWFVPFNAHHQSLFWRFVVLSIVCDKAKRPAQGM